MGFIKGRFVFFFFSILALGVMTGDSSYSHGFHPVYPSDAYATCHAYTDCLDEEGVAYDRIWCRAWSASDGYARCNYSVIPNEYVECNGYNSRGQWVHIWRSCRR